MSEVRPKAHEQRIPAGTRTVLQGKGRKRRARGGHAERGREVSGGEGRGRRRSKAGTVHADGSPGELPIPPAGMGSARGPLTIETSPRTPPPLPEPEPPTDEDRDEIPNAEQAPAADASAPGATMTAAGLVDLIELANTLAVSSTAARLKIAPELPEVQARMHFDPLTRKKLEALAPAALPYVQSWMQDHALIGLLAFCGSAAWTIAANMGALKRLAPREVAADPTKPAAPEAPPRPIGMEGPPPGFPGS